MQGKDRNRHLVEHIVKLRDFLRENRLDIGSIMDGEGLAAFLSLPGAQEHQTACEMVRLMEEMPGGVLIHHAGGGEEIVYANRALLRIFQCATGEEFRELTGGSFRGMVHPEDLEEVEESIRAQIAGSRYDLDYVEYRIIRKDGAVRWIEEYGHFVRGGAVGDVFYVFIGDATEKRNRLMAERDSLLNERRRGEEQELEQKRMLAEALENATRAIGAKNTFLSNMSHDMRTPLNAIFGFTALARSRRRDPDAVQDYLERIETAGHQLLDLINKVLELSQTESGQTKLEEVECSLCDTIQEVCDFLRPQAVEKDIDFSLDCSGVIHDDIYGDQEKLKQLVMYLANNAVTYTKSGGRVAITASEREKLPNQCAVYQLLVEDTGIGISREFLERIFEPFTRERNTTLSGIHGIGLGLTIAKNIVDMMGGAISAESEVGRGSAFTITLRFRIQPEAAAAAGALRTRSRGKKILLVEDNEINQEIETEILREMGFLVETAEDGRAAVEKVSRAAPGEYDLILMDLQMPVMNGWQAAQAIRGLADPARAGIPIIALSANVFESDIRRSMESGMDAHLPKPLDVRLLLRTMEEIRNRPAGSHVVAM